jgi:hypothetical protein
MVYIDTYTYIQVQIRTYTGETTIRIYGQIENSKKRDETLYSRLVLPTEAKGGLHNCWRAPPPFSLGSEYKLGLKDPFSTGWFTRD